MYRVRRHVEVERDILEAATWIARDSLPAAYRFFESVERSVRSLGSMPGRGSPKPFRERRLAGVRSLAVSGFARHLILYQMKKGEANVLAVIHGAREYRKLLRGRTD